MQILESHISREELQTVARNFFGDMVKCVADVKNGKLAIDAEFHADLERLLLENGSDGKDLWGFNVYPDDTGEDFIEFDSLINIRAWQGNPSRNVLDSGVRDAIRRIVNDHIR